MSPESNAPRPDQQKGKRKRAWSLQIATVAGIPIYLHFTFLLLLLFVAWVEYQMAQQVLPALLFIVAVFASVCLHELGHAMMARRYGIQTDEIVLYPIGGVARLHSMGEGLQEFWISIAGPTVNILIALGILGILVATGQPIVPGEHLFTSSGYFLQHLLLANVILVLFNIIPAFPMDGGRLLRAVLTQKFSKARATSIASKCGQALAILFMIWGFMWGHVILMFIGLFVFLAAGQEYAATRQEGMLVGHKIRDAMITRFNTLAHGDTLGKAVDQLLSTSQEDFPIVHGDDVIGVLTRKNLIQGLASHGREHYVAEVMQRDFPRFHPEDDLHKTWEAFRRGEGPVLVFDGDRLVGYIDQENLNELLMIAAQTDPRPQQG